MSAIVNDLAILLVFLLIGFALRELIKPLQKLFLPAGLIGGIVALLVGPQVLGWVNLPESWSGMASPMINIVLTCLMFGTALNKSKLRTYAGASAGQLFEDLGADGMLSIGLILATLGLIIAMVVGIILVNIAVRKGYATNLPIGDDGKIKTICGPIPAEKQKSLGKATASSDAINGLALQLAIVLFCMWLGGKVFALVQLVIPAASNVPSLLYGIVGAFIVWPVMRKLHLDNYADKTAINNISGVALEICICSATATLNLKIFADYLVPILIHMVVIVIIMVFVCMVLTKRWLKKDWLELALLFFGQGTGSAPSGMALGRCVDPDTKNKSAWEGFGIATGVFSPVSSVLVAVLPMLAVQSAWIPVGIGAAVTLLCVLFGELVLRKNN